MREGDYTVWITRRRFDNIIPVRWYTYNTIFLCSLDSRMHWVHFHTGMARNQELYINALNTGLLNGIKKGPIPCSGCGSDLRNYHKKEIHVKHFGGCMKDECKCRDLFTYFTRATQTISFIPQITCPILCCLVKTSEVIYTQFTCVVQWAKI